MRVAFDARSLSSPVLRGWDRYTVGLVGELVRVGTDVTLFHRSREPIHASHVADLGCRVLGLPDHGGLYWEQVAVPLALWRGPPLADVGASALRWLTGRDAPGLPGQPFLD